MIYKYIINLKIFKFLNTIIPKKSIVSLISIYVFYKYYIHYKSKCWTYIPYINRKVLTVLSEIKNKASDDKSKIINNVSSIINIETNKLPIYGLSNDIIDKYINTLTEHDTKFKLISGAIYDNNNDYHNIMCKAYNKFAYSNPMHGDIFNSVVFMERNIITIIGNLLDNDNPSGTITNGGTESLFLAVKTYRDLKDTENPNLVVFDTMHCSIDKICHYLKIKLYKVKTDNNHRGSFNNLLCYIDKNTIAVILSTPSYGFGIMDDVKLIAPLLKVRGIPVHVDACLGGFIWMFQDFKNEYSFNIVGVSSISVCLHKYGYSHKGVSSIIYNEPRLLEYQYFASNDWDGGLYVSPSFLGSRSGGLVAQAWVGLLSRGYIVYKNSSNYILKLSQYTYEKLINICVMFPLDLNIVSFHIGENTYKCYDYLVEKGFLLNSLQNPPAIHICITLLHTETLIDELYNHIHTFINNKDIHIDNNGLAPIYGMKSGIPINSNEIMDMCIKQFLSSKYTTD